LNKHVEVPDAIPNGVKKSVLPVFNNMFKSKSDKMTTNGNKDVTVLENRTPNANEHVLCLFYIIVTYFNNKSVSQYKHNVPC
jgi:hypothetical protein